MPNTTAPSAVDPPVFRELSLIGGHPALDFLNTVKYRGATDPQDKLSSLSDVMVWAHIAGLLSEEEAKRLSRQSKESTSARRVYGEICAFREQVRILFENANQKSVRTVRAIARVEAEISALRPVATIDPESGVLTRRVVVKTVDDLKARIVAAVAEVLTERTNLRIKSCNGHDCDWLFIDRTKAARRKWCDTRTCGNNDRVRRYRSKH
jgi:predicted RNA-binding Zn ribbon-like protein